MPEAIARISPYDQNVYRKALSFNRGFQPPDERLREKSIAYSSDFGLDDMDRGGINEVGMNNKESYRKRGFTG